MEARSDAGFRAGWQEHVSKRDEGGSHGERDRPRERVWWHMCSKRRAKARKQSRSEEELARRQRKEHGSGEAKNHSWGNQRCSNDEQVQAPQKQRKPFGLEGKANTRRTAHGSEAKVAKREDEVARGSDRKHYPAMDNQCRNEIQELLEQFAYGGEKAPTSWESQELTEEWKEIRTLRADVNALAGKVAEAVMELNAQKEKLDKRVRTFGAHRAISAVYRIMVQTRTVGESWCRGSIGPGDDQKASALSTVGN